MANPNRGNKEGVNVQVILRCRPFSRLEQTRADANRHFVICKEDAKEVLVSQNVGGGKQLDRAFHFDKVFGPDSGQERLYNQAVSPIVEEVLEGFNCTIFAYGQTGTGKTYTMEGGDRDSADGNNLSEVAGVIPRAIHQIFTTLDGNDSEYTVKCSFLELYNEETMDLLAVGDRQDQKLRIMEDRSGVVIQGLEEFIVKSSVDIFALLDRGSAKRRTAETQLNKQSSRSHSVFCITVHMREIAADGEEVIKIGKLYLVDLAGSENVSRSGAAGTMAKEAGSINKSLLTLGRVITALVEGSGHIPYRDSKLTRLLRDSLGGKTKTCIIATIAPTTHCQDETLSTLDYAHRAKNIRNRPEVNQKISKTAHIRELNAEIDRLKAELNATREKNGIYLPADQYQQREELSKVNAARLENLEAEMEQNATKGKEQVAKLEQRISNLHKELSESTEACRQAKLAIGEREYLILCHTRSEEEIVAKSAGVTTELQQASSSMDTLHDRLRESAAREQRNAGVIKDLQLASEARFTQMQSSFGEAMRSANGLLQQSSTQLQRLSDQKDQDALALQLQAIQNAGVQGRLSAIHASLEAISGATTAGTSEMREAIIQSLRSLHQAEAEFVASHQEVASRTQAVTTSLMQSVVDANKAHQVHLETAAKSQAEATATLLSAVHSGINQGAIGLECLVGEADACRNIADNAMAAQNKELTDFKTSFSLSIAEEKNDLLTRIGGMLSQFASRKADAVSQAIHQFSQHNHGAAKEVGARSQQLHDLALSAQQSLKAEETNARLLATTLATDQEQQIAKLQESLGASNTQCRLLELELKQNWDTEAQKMQDHITQMATLTQSSIGEMEARSARCGEACSAGVSVAEEGCRALGSACGEVAVADKAALSEINGLALRTTDHLSGSCASHLENVSALATQINQTTSERFEQDAYQGVIPDKVRLDMPAVAWYDDMRTPAADILLAECRKQRDGLPGTPNTDPALLESAEGANTDLPDDDMECGGELGQHFGAENSDPNMMAEAAALPKSRIPGMKEKPSIGEGDGGKMVEANKSRKRQRAN